MNFIAIQKLAQEVCGPTTKRIWQYSEVSFSAWKCFKMYNYIHYTGICTYAYIQIQTHKTSECDFFCHRYYCGIFGSECMHFQKLDARVCSLNRIFNQPHRTWFGIWVRLIDSIKFLVETTNFPAFHIDFTIIGHFRFLSLGLHQFPFPKYRISLFQSIISCMHFYCNQKKMSA